MNTKVRKTYYLESDLVDRIEKISKEQKRTLSGQLEMIISNWLKNLKK